MTDLAKKTPTTKKTPKATAPKPAAPKAKDAASKPKASPKPPAPKPKAEKPAKADKAKVEKPKAEKPKSDKPAKAAKPVKPEQAASSAKKPASSKTEPKKTAPAKPEPKAATKAQTKPEKAAKEAKAETPSGTKASAKPVESSKKPAAAKPEPKSEAKSAAKPGKSAKTETKPEAKTDTKPEAKPAPKSESKPGSKTDAKPDGKPAKADKSGAKATEKPAEKQGGKQKTAEAKAVESDDADADKKSGRKGITVVESAKKPATKPKPVSKHNPPERPMLMGPGSRLTGPLIPSGPSAPKVTSLFDAPKSKRTKSPLTKAKLDKYRWLLISKRAELFGDVQSMENEALRSESGGLSNTPQHIAEQGSENYDQSLSLNLAAQDRRVIKEIDEALKRIEDGSYGLCELTNQPIPEERLDEIPWARYTIEAARQIELRGGSAMFTPGGFSQ